MPLLIETHRFQQCHQQYGFIFAITIATIESIGRFTWHMRTNTIFDPQITHLLHSECRHYTCFRVC